MLVSLRINCYYYWCWCAFTFTLGVPTLMAQEQPDHTLCQGSYFELRATGGYESYSWLPDGAFIVAQGAIASIRPARSQVYTVRARRRLPLEYVLDPTFARGGLGIESELVRSAAPAFAPGSYVIVSDAEDLDGAHEPCPNLGLDPDDRFMAIHVEGGRSARAWCQQVDVIAGEEYAAQFTATTMGREHLPSLRLFVDDVAFGPARRTDNFPCAWRTFTQTWRAETSAKVKVCIAVESPSSGSTTTGLDNVSIRRFDVDLRDTFRVEVVPVPREAEVSKAICAGSRFRDQGFDLSDGQTGTLRYPLASGCDSVVKFTVVEVDALRQNFTYADVCSGDSLSVAGVAQPLRRDTSIIQTYVSRAGCDSVVTTVVEFFGVDDLAVVQFDPECGEAFGSVEIEGSAAGRLRFAWSDGVDAGGARADLPAGSMSRVVVTNQAGCEQPLEITIPLSTKFEVETNTLTSPSCPEYTDGAVALSFRGASFPVRGLLLDPFREIDNLSDPELELRSLPAGVFRLTLTDARGCGDTATFTIAEPPQPTVQLFGEARIPLGSSGRYRFRATGPFTPGESDWRFVPLGGDTLRLEPTADTLAFRPPFAGSLLVTLIDSRGCVSTVSKEITFETPGNPLFPSAFTPNGDGLHDVFAAVEHPGLVAVEELQIFDRWGRLVARPADGSPARTAWAGEGCAPGVYAYTASLRFADGTKYRESGSVTLLR